MTDTNEGFTIDMTQPGMRRKVAMVVLMHRLEMAIHFRKTDSMALHSARGWALKEEPKNRPKTEFKTMRQALVWVKAQVDKDQAEAAAQIEQQGPHQGPSGEQLI